MTDADVLRGLRTLQFGLHLRFPDTQRARELYQDELRPWSVKDWDIVVQGFLDMAEPPRRFPSTGQCKAALQKQAHHTQKTTGKGCAVCHHTGWAEIPYPKNKPGQHYVTNVRCRCDKGMAMTHGYTRESDRTFVSLDQLTDERYSAMLRDAHECTRVRAQKYASEWIEETDANGVTTVRKPNLSELLKRVMARMAMSKHSVDEAINA